MDAELREYLEALRAGQDDLRAAQDSLRGDMVTMEQRLERTIDTRTQMLSTEMKSMEARLIEAIKHRKEDEDLAFRKIDGLTRRMRRLEKRVEAVEARVPAAPARPI